jgi:membrane dipeptidase
MWFIVGKLFWVCFSTPQGLEDVSKYPQLMAALLEDPSWTEEDLKKLAGLNLLRVFRAVEEVGTGL